MPASASDTISLDAVDPRWLRARWTLCEATVKRAAKSMGAAFHTAVLVMRVQQLAADESSTTLRTLSEHPLPDDSTQWFASVPETGTRYRVQIGFVSGSAFYAAVTSEVVATPRHPSSVATTGVPLAPDILAEIRELQSDSPTPFEVAAELVLRGHTQAGASVSCDGEPVRVERSGRFEVRYPLSSGRHVLPIETQSPTSDRSTLVIAAAEFSLRDLSGDE